MLVTGTSYSYGGAGGSYANGAIVSQSSYTYKNNQYQYSSTLTNSFKWIDSAQQLTISNNVSGNQNGTTTSTFAYDKNGHIGSVLVTGQNARTLELRQQFT